ncbi:MAG: peptidoglycan DD-metalloendopeptidase family protein [Chlorobi bacterium]|nr:peptidoglycan DD-metalloendopeptidase family protein [Chlorobiota bacterium]
MEEMNTKQRLHNAWHCIINSYGQVFFSKNPVFAIILFIVTFFDLYAGIAGLLAVILSNSVASLLGLSKIKIREGAYGFNSLLVGLGVGIYYQPGVEFYIILLMVSVITLFFSVTIEGILGKYGLPYLSIPFLLGIWTIIIATKSYSALNISERGVYNLNDMYAIGGLTMVKLYEWFNNLAVPESLRIYFKSLSAILFQYHMFAGILIAVGLVYYSRIAFLLSLIGFYTAYYFYLFIGANLNELAYSYIGFNYILTAIAIGGFFIVPSRRSVLWVIFLTPLIAIILSSTAYIFSYFQLSVFSLPFNIIVIMFLYVLKFREKDLSKLALVTIQQFSPEKHAYNFNNYMDRFGNLPWIAMKLPFWGEWKVTQAHGGQYTHKDNWKHAWDFEIADDEDKVYADTGNKPEDYYCYNKPVIATADGTVEAVKNDVEDNPIGDVDMKNNWGNSVVIKHAEKLYSQVSHLKKDSIKVEKGQIIKQGELIGYCGNSGRSPVPHLHFQFQSTPDIGSKTISYPISSYIVRDNENFKFQLSGIPEKDQRISNLTTNEIIKKAFHFVPGEKMRFETETDGKTVLHEWLIEADIYNNIYFVCQRTGAKAWFRQSGNVFYFTQYNGKPNTLLYFFYLSSFKVVSAFYKNMQLKDDYPLTVFPNKKWLFLQDFLIPFFKFLKAEFTLNYKSLEKGKVERIVLESSSAFGRRKRVNDTFRFSIRLTPKGIEKLEISHSGKTITANRKF